MTGRNFTLQSVRRSQGRRSGSIRPEREGAGGEERGALATQESQRVWQEAQKSQRVWQEAAALCLMESEEVGDLAGMAQKEMSQRRAGCHPRASEPTRGWDSIRSL